MSKNYRPYTLQEAFDKFGRRSYTYVDQVVTGNYEDDGTPLHTYQIDGIVISAGVIRARIHRHIEDENYVYVSLADLLTHWRWPDGTRCGVKIEEW